MNDMIEPVGFFGQIKTKISLFGISCEKIEIVMVSDKSEIYMRHKWWTRDFG